MEIKFKKEKDEDGLLYQLRICGLKDSEGMTWEEIKDIINTELGLSYSSSAYRKKYQYYQMCREKKEVDDSNKKEYIEELNERIEDLKREKFRLNDIRAAYNRDLREEARKQALEEIISKEVKKLQPYKFVPTKIENNNTDLIINLCDIHYGLIVDTYWNKYSPEIARIRLEKYLSEILKAKETFKAQNAFLVLGGDNISGNIHLTIQLRNRENVIQQIMGVSELLSWFASELANNFETLSIVGVSGNHSRLTKKEDSPIDERADDLVPWFLKSRLSNFKNVEFVDNTVNNTFSIFDVRDTRFCLVHGDYDKPSTVQNLLTMIPMEVDACIFGHKHHNYIEWIQNKPMIMSGSLCGIDDFCISNRINGRPQQLIVVVDNEGINSYRDVDLDV